MSFPAPLLSIVLIIASAVAAQAAETAPTWAYPVNPANDPPPPDDGALLHVPGSTIGLTRTRIAAIAGEVPDWLPNEHPPMPAIVARGRAPEVYACAYCHLPTGAGRPENANLTGLTPAYFKQQVHAFQNDERPGSEPARLPQTAMIALAKALTEDEIDAAAAYFSSLPPVSFVRVIETDRVPKTVVAGWMLARDPRGGTEPMGNRIIEIAEDFARFEKRDSHTPYIAYVPVGSLTRGEELANTGGNGRTLQCATCHGPDLKGMQAPDQPEAPLLAGRSPGYLARQLFDLRNGTRNGDAVTFMQPVVSDLSNEDIVALAAYLASLKP